MLANYSIYIKHVTGNIIRIRLSTGDIFDIYRAVERISRYYTNCLLGSDISVRYSAFGPSTECALDVVRAIHAVTTLDVNEGSVLKSETTVFSPKGQNRPFLADFGVKQAEKGGYESVLLADKARCGICLIDASKGDGITVWFLHGPNGRHVASGERRAYDGYNANAWLDGEETNNLKGFEREELRRLAVLIDGSSVSTMAGYLRDIDYPRFFDLEANKSFMKHLGIKKGAA